MWPLGQAVKTPPSQGGIMGSIPVWVTNQYIKIPSKKLEGILGLSGYTNSVVVELFQSTTCEAITVRIGN